MTAAERAWRVRVNIMLYNLRRGRSVAQLAKEVGIPCNRLTRSLNHPGDPEILHAKGACEVPQNVLHLSPEQLDKVASVLGVTLEELEADPGAHPLSVLDVEPLVKAKRSAPLPIYRNNFGPHAHRRLMFLGLIYLFDAPGDRQIVRITPNGLAALHALEARKATAIASHR